MKVPGLEGTELLDNQQAMELENFNKSAKSSDGAGLSLR